MTLPDPATTDPVDVAAALCDVPSVSGEETALADAIEAALRGRPHLDVVRDGDCVVARTALGRAARVIVAGHIDTVPLAGNLPSRRFVVDAGAGAGGDAAAGAETTAGTEVLWGRGSVDMKGGVAVALHLAATLTAPRWDVTWVFYDHEEVSSDLNGLGRAARNHPEWFMGADLAILGEPTNAGIEGGCNGTLRVAVTTRGRVAHSARAWLGVNAVHAAAPVLARLAAYEARTVTVDGLDYRESLGAVGITGGVAMNSVPDTCTVQVNYRFAPSTTGDDALAHVRELFAGLDVEIRLQDVAPGARPGLDHPVAAGFVRAVAAATGREPVAKVGWTDVARFAALGIPAVNYGPGDPGLAHADDEQCPTQQIHSCAAGLRAWLTEGEDTTS